MKIIKMLILNIICIFVIPVLMTTFKTKQNSGENIFNIYGSTNFRNQVVDMGNHSLLEKKLDKEKMKMINYRDLRLIRNTLFAKYGYGCL